jgi:Fe-S-cluster containining protein
VEPLLPNDPHYPSDLKRLERQMERGQLFVHTALSENFTRLSETETFLHAAIDLLLAKGLIEEEELREAIVRIRQEQLEREERVGPGTMIRLEESVDEPEPPVLVDCSARLHLCHAACCTLDFALSTSEIEGGKAKWDLGRPYFIRQEEDGYCTHCNRQTGECGIYTDRPGVCRGYSCAHDERIWKDFAKMEPNSEWIESYLATTSRPHLLGASSNTSQHKPNLIQVTRRGQTQTDMK